MKAQTRDTIIAGAFVIGYGSGLVQLLLLSNTQLAAEVVIQARTISTILIVGGLAVALAGRWLPVRDA